MKKCILPLALVLTLLTSCSAMLERSYSVSAPHVDRPTVAEDPSALRVENYRELVSAVLYLVSQGAEEGVIQLYDYTGSVENDLTSACLEVATEDPLGAYAVDYIKHEYTRVVSYYQATLSIHYRRSQEQIHSMVNVTGTGAIRTELQEALSRFEPEVILRVGYFSEDEDSIAQLIRQAYYDAPVTALGMPQAEISLYPDSGRERVVEIRLTYPENAEELRRESEYLTQELKTMPGAQENTPEDTARQRATELWTRAAYAPDGGSTAYAALADGAADEQGMALTYTLLSRQAGLSCEVVEGLREEEPWFWNVLTFPGGEIRYLDPSEDGGGFYTAQELFDRGYRWADGPEEPEMPEEEADGEEGEPEEAIPVDAAAHYE